MVEKLPAVEAALRIEYHHFAQEVELNLVHQLERLRPVAFVVLALQFLETAGDEVVLDAGSLNSHDFDDFLELVGLALSLEEGVAGDHVVEDAAQGPDVDLRPVFLAAQQQLWSSVVQGADHIGHGSLQVVEFLGHAQIDDFDVVVVGIDVCGFWLRLLMREFGREHDVGGFEVAVEEVVGVKFECAFEYLLENLLDCELFLAHYHPIEVGGQPLHHHHRLLLPHKGLDHADQVLAVENLEDVAFADEADGQADLAQRLEALHRHHLLALVAARLVDHPVRTLLHLLQDRVLVLEGGALHPPPSRNNINIIKLQSISPHHSTGNSIDLHIKKVLFVKPIFLLVGQALQNSR